MKRHPAERTDLQPDGIDISSRIPLPQDDQPDGPQQCTKYLCSEERELLSAFELAQMMTTSHGKSQAKLPEAKINSKVVDAPRHSSCLYIPKKYADKPIPLRCAMVGDTRTGKTYTAMKFLRGHVQGLPYSATVYDEYRGSLEVNGLSIDLTVVDTVSGGRGGRLACASVARSN